MIRPLACALIHYPVLARDGQIVTSAITNIDLHDISRSALSFGLTSMFVIHPVEAQRLLATRIRNHWVDGSGGKRIPDRKPALEILRIVSSLDEATEALGPDTEIWTTSARTISGETTCLPDARKKLQEEGPPVLLCLGTGWGLDGSVHDQASVHLDPIQSPREDGYNHLSVRAAAAILFDRLRGVV